jgi:hypothetical protein
MSYYTARFRIKDTGVFRIKSGIGNSFPEQLSTISVQLCRKLSQGDISVSDSDNLGIRNSVRKTPVSCLRKRAGLT